MSSQVEIANRALLKVGATRINSMQDNKTEAVVINEYYELAYQWMLAQYPWSFAMKVEALSRIPEAPLEDYAFAYELPQNYIWVQRVYPNSNFKIMGTQLWTNEKQISVKFIERADEAIIPAYFEQAFMVYLASLIAVPLTENVQKEMSLVAQATQHLKKAKSLNAQQQPQDGFQDFPVYNSRFGGGVAGYE